MKKDCRDCCHSIVRYEGNVYCENPDVEHGSVEFARLELSECGHARPHVHCGHDAKYFQPRSFMVQLAYIDGVDETLAEEYLKEFARGCQ